MFWCICIYVPLKRMIVDLAIRLPFPLSAYWATSTHCIGATDCLWGSNNAAIYDDLIRAISGLTTRWLAGCCRCCVRMVRVSRAHVPLRWKMMKRDISYTDRGTSYKNDVREYYTLLHLAILG